MGRMNARIVGTMQRFGKAYPRDIIDAWPGHVPIRQTLAHLTLWVWNYYFIPWPKLNFPKSLMGGYHHK